MRDGGAQPTVSVHPPGRPPAGAPPEAILEELAEELLARGGRVWRRVASDSMAPLLQPGDRIFVEPCTPERARCGDIIVFRSPAGTMVHRLLAVRRGRSPALIEKGDANAFAGAIDPAALMGRVCLRWRGGASVDLLDGCGRLVQVALLALSLAEMAGVVAERFLRRALRIDRRFGVGGRASAPIRRAAARLVRLLEPGEARGDSR